MAENPTLSAGTAASLREIQGSDWRALHLRMVFRSLNWVCLAEFQVFTPPYRLCIILLGFSTMPGMTPHSKIIVFMTYLSP